MGDGNLLRAQSVQDPVKSGIRKNDGAADSTVIRPKSVLVESGANERGEEERRQGSDHQGNEGARWKEAE
jgi:hypothetical protein